jgi:hypothetical protein
MIWCVDVEEVAFFMGSGSWVQYLVVLGKESNMGAVGKESNMGAAHGKVGAALAKLERMLLHTTHQIWMTSCLQKKKKNG